MLVAGCRRYFGFLVSGDEAEAVIGRKAVQFRTELHSSSKKQSLAAVSLDELE
jgi:hypothetical protein